MKRLIHVALVLALVAVAAGSIGCSKKPAPVVAPPPQMEPARPAQPATPPPPAPQPPQVELSFQPAFFDYDKYNLRPDAVDALTHDAKLLADNATVRILIEGHCDERGTREYNLALGDRRARAAKDFLVRYGIDASRIETISYGKERPFAMGSNEAAWQQNRRAHFVVKK
jgi:peptidoglycan-associated lipoprotein